MITSMTESFDNFSTNPLLSREMMPLDSDKHEAETINADSNSIHHDIDTRVRMKSSDKSIRDSWGSQTL